MQLYVLQGFPGIGFERATKLLDKFGSIRNIINLSAEDLLQTPGFTKNIARGFIELLE